jgi:membrane-associated phospholipid phosphatase
VAVTSNLRHHTGVLPWLVAAGVGGSVAAERVLAGRHFYSDVILGGVTGALFGSVIPVLHAHAPAVIREVSFVARDDGFEVLWRRRF